MYIECLVNNKHKPFSRVCPAAGIDSLDYVGNMWATKKYHNFIQEAYIAWTRASPAPTGPNVPRLRSVLDLVLRPVAVQRLPSLQVPEGRAHLVDVGDLRVVQNKPHLVYRSGVQSMKNRQGAGGGGGRGSPNDWAKHSDLLARNVSAM